MCEAGAGDEQTEEKEMLAGGEVEGVGRSSKNSRAAVKKNMRV